MQVFVDSVRLDKWLWAARFFKSRTLAVTAIEAGRVLVADERAKPARLIKVGERLKINRDQERMELVVRGISEQRKSAPLARLLYEETAQSVLARQTAAENRRFFSEPSQEITGRPTKRNRRALERWKEV
jgi:ribosome-associated heat shock protein Hsp15